MQEFTFSPNQLCALSDWVVLHIDGPEAASFLQSQLTNSVSPLTNEQAVMAGFCQAQGRLQASFVIWNDPRHIEQRYALIHRSIADKVSKRLSMFLLRTKAKIHISSASVYGVTREDSNPLTLPTTTFAVQHQANQSIIQAPSTHQAQAWLIDYAGRALDATANADTWLSRQLRTGFTWIEESTYELFLPQDINYDIIGGVSFKKGCFPGQEVVARLHYRTTARRRGILGTITAEYGTLNLAAADVFSTEQADRPIGRIINSAYDHQNSCYVLLFEAPIKDIATQTLYALEPQGPAICLQTLPFSWEIAKY